MAEFDLAAVLGSAAKPSGAERIEYIPYQRIFADQGNFYSLDGIEELAANIEMIGLQQPIRVKKVPGSYKFVEQYRVVSGHRRLAAWRKLDLNCPDETYRNIPAIVEPERDEPEALQQLRLIYANSDTRKMTGRDLQRQAERIQELLQALKDAGYQFPGRMRDYVAEICGVSKSKLSRLDAIKHNLHAGIYSAYYQTGKISEAAASAISSLPMEEQSNICRKLGKGWQPTLKDLTQYITGRKTADAETEAELQAVVDRVRSDYEHLAATAEENVSKLGTTPEPEKNVPKLGTTPEPEENVPKMGTIPRPEENVPNLGTIPEPEENVPKMGTIPKPQWLTGDPPGRGLYWCRIRFNDGVGEIHQCLEFWPERSEPWHMKNGYGIHDTCEVTAWWPIPED